MTIIEADSVQRIRESALNVIQQSGILGLRVADVAAGANVSVALVYKYFGDRDGLLAGVLGEAIVQQFEEELVAIERLLGAAANDIEIAHILAIMPKPDDTWRRQRRWLRLEAKAAAREIPVLAAQIGQAMHRVETATADLIVKARKASGNTSDVPARTIAWMIVAFSDGFSNGDLSPEPFTNDLYMPLISDLLKRHVF